MVGRNEFLLLLAVALPALLFIGCAAVGVEEKVAATPATKWQERAINYQYVEERANEAGIRFTKLKTSKPRENTNTRVGYTDRSFEIASAGKRGARAFHRQSIAKYLYLLEGRHAAAGCDAYAQPGVTALSLENPSEDRERWDMQ